MAELAIKRGAALVLGLAFTDDAGVAQDVTGAVITSELRDQDGALVAELPVVMTSPATGIGNIVVADTSAWPEAVLRGDVRVLLGGLPAFSETFAVRVLARVTG